MIAQAEVFVYGNCLSRPIYNTNDDFLRCSDDGPEDETFDGWYVHPDAESRNFATAPFPIQSRREA